MTTETVNVFAKAGAPAVVAASAVAFIEANKASDSASTPFARSTLAAVMAGTSVAMIEGLIIAAMGSPKSPATSKPIAKVSGLRDFDGGARLYQAWKEVTFILDNLEADAWLVAPGVDDSQPDGVPGANVIRPAVVAFILQDADSAKALFGKTGISGIVKAAMADHGKALASLAGVEPAGEGETATDASPVRQSLTDRANALLLAMQEASDDEFVEAHAALATMADYLDQRAREFTDAPRAESAADAAVTLAKAA